MSPPQTLPLPDHAGPLQEPAAHRAVSLRVAVGLLWLTAALLAAALALGLAAWWGAGLWVAPVAAALGVAAAALPLGLLVSRLARQSSSGVTGSTLAPTGLSRELFLELAGREWARARRYGTGAALLVVEVDRAERLAQALGDQAVDAALVELLANTAPTLRGADVLTRFSASQMAVFLAPADATGALDVAERIRERVEQMEVPFQPQQLRLTVSIGVAHLRPAHLNLQALIDDADDALAAAQQSGGNCVRAAPVASASPPPADRWANGHRARPH
jgi:diguanylate cyclase